MSVQSMPQVFLSYPHQSMEVGRRLANYLRDHGSAPVWIDAAEISAGDHIAWKLREAIRKATCCVLVLNTFSRDSTWCMAEIGAFWGAGKPIIVFPTEPLCDPPPFLAGFRTAQNEEEVAAACQRFTKDVLLAEDLENPLLAALHGGGLRNAFRIPHADHPRENRVRQMIDAERSHSAGRCFRLLASSGFSYLHPHGKVWRTGGLGHAIASGEARLIAVLASPFSPFAVTRALANNAKFHHWHFSLPFGVLIELSRYSNLQIRVTDHPVNCSLFFNRTSVFYDPYLWGRPGIQDTTENNFWALEFEHLPDPQQDCYSLLTKHFDFLLDQSISLANFLSDGEEGYEQKSLEFREKIEQLRRKEKE